MTPEVERLVEQVREALDKLDDEGDCTCREKASVGVIYPCEHHLSQGGLAALSDLTARIERWERIEKAARKCIQTGMDEDGKGWYALDPRGQRELAEVLGISNPATALAAPETQEGT